MTPSIDLQYLAETVGVNPNQSPREMLEEWHAQERSFVDQWDMRFVEQAERESVTSGTSH